MNAELAQDRGAVIAENFPLVHKFVASQIPPGPVARAGGPEAAASAGLKNRQTGKNGSKFLAFASGVSENHPIGIR